MAKDLIKESGMPMKNLYLPTEIRDGVNNYITLKNLVDNKNKKMVLLDDLLFGMVNKKRTDPTVSRSISRAQILEPTLKNNFTEHFQIYDSQGTPLFKSPMRGSPPRIKILTEMKIGRKVITKVSNFEQFGINPETLAADLRKMCSGSTTIGETMTSPKTAEVQVQGPHGQIIIDHLNKLGVPTKWIDYENKLKAKKKRK